MDTGKEEKILRRKVFAVQYDVDKALQKHFQCQLWKLRNPEDQLRLLVFQLWAEKYHVELDEVVQILVSFYRRLMSPKLKHVPVFGARLSTLTGQHAETVLQQELKKRYPNDELELNWKQKQRDEQLAMLGSEQVKLEVETGQINSFLKSYAKIVKQKQELISRNSILCRRRYRGFPW